MKKFKFTEFLFRNNSEIYSDTKMFGAELRRLVSLANKRIKRLDDLSPAKKDISNDAILKNGKFTAKGSMEDKIATYNKLKNFINSPTSTKTGFNEYVNKIAEKKKITPEQVKDILSKANQQVGSIILDTHEIYSLVNNDNMVVENPFNKTYEEYDKETQKKIDASYQTVDEQIKEKAKEYEDFLNKTQDSIQFKIDDIEVDSPDLSLFDDEEDEDNDY